MEESVNGIHQDVQLPLKLLLFIDKRPGSAEAVQEIRQYLKGLEEHFSFQLDVVDVGEQPYLAEHYKLVASPALIKLTPPPQQILAGRDIVSQLELWWPKWHREASDSVKALARKGGAFQNLDWSDLETEVSHSAEIMRLSDEIFRLNQTKDELEAQLRFKDRIISMLAHDLRNPLTAASIAVETLEMGHAPQQGSRSLSLSPELTAQLLKHAKTQIRAIDRMITDILDAARGASAQLQLQPKPLNLHDLCLDVVESFQRRFAEKQQKAIADIPQDLPVVYADAEQIRRVIVNLIDNAVKYTPEGGTIEISALHRTTQKVQVTIHDTGPGIPSDNQDKIFEERYRLQRDESKDGYGLGLSLCQRIIRAHYGQIWVDSEPGEGSYFFFTLPVYRN